jgi:hypothetical protein
LKRSDVHVDLGEVRRWLGAVFATAPRDAFVELRFRLGAGMGQSFHRVDELDEAAAAAVAHARQRDVFAGVVARSRRGGRRQDLVPEAGLVWADCDGSESVAALWDFRPAPSMVVASGTERNCHAYWVLTCPVSRDVLELTNRQLANALGADPQSTDAARILRPGGTANWKRQPCQPVRLATLDLDARVDLDELRRHLPELAEPRREPALPRTRTTGADSLLQVPPIEYVERLTGQQVGRDHKISCPFHSDASPSLHVYDEPERGWYCFGCGRGGSIFDFAGLLWGRDLRGADFVRLRQELEAMFLGGHRRSPEAVVPKPIRPAAPSRAGFGLGGT